MLNERLLNVESTSKPKFNVDSTFIQHSMPAGLQLLNFFFRNLSKVFNGGIYRRNLSHMKNIS
jgi:hypothetical protein